MTKQSLVHMTSHTQNLRRYRAPKRAPHKIILIIITLMLFIYHHSVIAGTRFSHYDNRYNNHSPLDFSLSFSKKDLDLESNSISYPIRQTRISVGMFNDISANLNIGLIIGSNFISQDNDVATAGLSLNGNHIGFAVNGFFGHNLQPGFHAQYLYQETRGENTLRTVLLTWHEWLTEATLRFNLGSHIAIIAGAGLAGLDADRRVRGDINETVRMKLDNNFQQKVAIELLTAPDDQIRLTITRGAFDGYQLTFAHTF